jgi:hypothetical protein
MLEIRRKSVEELEAEFSGVMNKRLNVVLSDPDGCLAHATIVAFYYRDIW